MPQICTSTTIKRKYIQDSPSPEHSYIHTPYEGRGRRLLDPEQHKYGHDSQSDINKVLEENSGFLPNCISMILILLSAGKRIFGGLSVKGAAKNTQK